MDFKTIAEFMYPFWILGALVILSVIAAGQKRLLRVEAKPVLKWIGVLVCTTGFRIFLEKVLHFHGFFGPPKGLSLIPWTASFTVFWEDACHGLPLVLLRKMIGNTKKWAKAVNMSALILVMLSFGLGHLYQGLMVPILLAFYIPYSIKIGKEYGFGTVIVCHTLYDMVTFLFVKYFMGM